MLLFVTLEGFKISASTNFELEYNPLSNLKVLRVSFEEQLEAVKLKSTKNSYIFYRAHGELSFKKVNSDQQLSSIISANNFVKFYYTSDNKPPIEAISDDFNHLDPINTYVLKMYWIG